MPPARSPRYVSNSLSLSTPTAMISLFLFTPIIATAASAIPELQSVDGCRFAMGSKEYDLCPVLSGSAASAALLESGERERDWEWVVRSTPCRPGTRSCSTVAGSGASSTAMDKDGSLPVALRIAQLKDAALIVEVPRASGSASVLRFECDPAVELEWTPGDDLRTKHACPLPDGFQALDSEAEDNTDSPPNEEDDSEQLLDGRNRTSRRATAIVFGVISAVVLSICIFTYKRPHFFSETLAPLVHRTTALLQEHAHLPALPNSFSTSLKPTGEGRLVRWAQEDMELDAEADVMVNGGDGEYDDFDAVGDEYIPLRPSPRAMRGSGSASGRWGKNYGTASSAARGSFW